MEASELEELLAGLWEQRRPNVMERVEFLAELAASADGGLSADVREKGRQEAHKLAGSLGSFGFPTASDHARIVERELMDDAPDASLLRDEVATMKAELEAGLPRRYQRTD
jgi:HPt (histidine-containing phosphotransfer) domain-containing protein